MPELQPGDLVVLLSVPASLLKGLPEEDQRAIQSAIGTTVIFAGMSYEQAELEFKDNAGDDHTIWVDSNRIRPA
jgi:hypothetical protein